MSLGVKLQQILEDPKQMNRVKIVFYALLALLVGGDFFIHREHANFAWDLIPGFSAVYGFISCVLIIIVSKFIGHSGGLMVREDYYENENPHPPEGGSAHHD